MAIPSTVAEFLENLVNFKSHYKDPLFSVSILRMIDSNTTNLIFDLLTTNLHINTIKTLPNIKESLNVLLKLNLIRKEDDRVFLDDNFRDSLLNFFCNPIFNRRLTRTESPNELTDEKLTMICEEKLRQILEFIVTEKSNSININSFNSGNINNSNNNSNINSNSNNNSNINNINSNNIDKVKDILHYSNLVDVNNQITNKGFEFLLLTHRDQLWLLIINSIRHYSQSKSDEISLFKLILEILMKKETGPYICNEFIPWFLFLNSLGIIFITEKRDDSIVFFIYNSVLLNNTFKKDSKFLILETNFKIYAYTSKSYEKSVLSLFSKTVCTFPSLLKANLSEESLQIAFDKGITARQIMKYLQEYSEGVPKNIENQINIWEQKQHRIRMRNGYLYHDFIHLSDFYQVLKFVEMRGALIYKDEQKRMIVGEERIHEEVKEFIKKI